jgi:predicted aspartyl protease
VGSVEVRRVTALVMPHDMPVALLGNSFLKHFRMHSDADQLVLERRP